MDELPDLDLGFDIPLQRPHRTIVLFKGAKRVQFSAQDLNVQRAAAIFKVVPETIYLEDESRKTHFPTASGNWDISNLRHFGNYSVEGEDERDMPAALSIEPSSSSYKTHSLKPSQSSHNLKNFINPKRKIQQVRKQIFLAEYDADKKPAVTGAVYLTIQEGKTSVDDVTALLKETQNTDDDYTLTDVRGLEITDSDSVNCLQFWKSAAKKILALKSDAFIGMQIHREFGSKVSKGKKRAKSRKDGNSSPDEEVSTRKLENMQREICEKIESMALDVSNKITNMSGKLNAIDNIGDKFKAVTEENNVVLSLSKILQCKICLKIPSSVVTATLCCQQVVGCGPCIQEWVLHNDCCILCKDIEVSLKLVHLKGFENLLSLIGNETQ